MRKGLKIMLLIVVLCSLVIAGIHFYTEYSFQECSYDIKEVQKVAWDSLQTEWQEGIIPTTESYRLTVLDDEGKEHIILNPEVNEVSEIWEDQKTSERLYHELLILPIPNKIEAYVNRNKLIVLVEFQLPDPGANAPIVAYVDPFDMKVIGYGLRW